MREALPLEKIPGRQARPPTLFEMLLPPWKPPTAYGRGFNVRAIVVDPWQSLSNEPHTFQGNTTISHGVISLYTQRFKTMDKRINPCGRRNMRRQSHRQFRSDKTTAGNMVGWKMIFLTFISSLVIMLERPTSETVPEVAGTATTGAKLSSFTRF